MDGVFEIEEKEEDKEDKIFIIRMDLYNHDKQIEIGIRPKDKSNDVAYLILYADSGKIYLDGNLIGNWKEDK